MPLPLHPWGGEGRGEAGGTPTFASFFIALVLAFLSILPAAAAPPGVLIVGQTAEPKSLDPHTVTALNDFRIAANLYDGLVRYRDGTLEIEPALAESWTVSEDGTVYTFHLRPGITFHDGTAFDAEAVAFNFRRMLEADHPYHDTGPFPLAHFFAAIREIEVVDPLTVRFRLDAPFAPLLSNLAYPTGFMVSPAAVRKWGKSYGRHPAGTGPFRFTTWDSGIRVVLERNDGYWDGAPALDAVVFRPIYDANTRVTELLAGGIDLVVGIPPDVIPILRDRADFMVHEQAGPHLWFLILNMREAPFSDRRMRLAVNYAIDRRALVEKVLQGTATVATGPVPRAFGWAYDTALDPYPYDPEKARALINEAGYAGEEIVFAVTQGGSGMLDPVAMATAIQADLAAVGLDVAIESFEWNTYLARVNRGLEGQAAMAEMAWMTNDPDTLPYLALRSAAFPEEGGFNSGYYANPEVDRLVEAARRTTDRNERARLYKAIQRIVHEDAPWAVIASWKQNAVTRAGVRGFRLQPSFLLRFEGVSKE